MIRKFLIVRGGKLKHVAVDVASIVISFSFFSYRRDLYAENSSEPVDWW